jgi:hypothetical protein
MCKRVYVIGTKTINNTNYVVGVQATNIYRAISKIPLENMDIRRSTFDNVASSIVTIKIFNRNLCKITTKY